MKYLTFAEKADARSRTGTIATELGCGQQPEDITKYWFVLIEHPTPTDSALCIPEGEEDKLTADERLLLKSRSLMEAEGWFSEPLI